MEKHKKKTSKQSFPLKGLLIFTIIFVASLFFILNLFRTPSLWDVLILGVFAFVGIYCMFGLYRRKNKLIYIRIGIILAIFLSSYLSSTVIRFSFISNNVRQWIGLFCGLSSMPDRAKTSLGIDFPEKTKFLYYMEGVAWLEQSAKLIATVDQEDLPQLVKSLGSKGTYSFTLKSKFWYTQYLYSKKKSVYTYANIINSKYGGAVTADILVVYENNNKAKLYMDIIYW